MESKGLARKINTGGSRSPWMGFRSGAFGSGGDGSARKIGPKRSARLISPTRDVMNTRTQIRGI